MLVNGLKCKANQTTSPESISNHCDNTKTSKLETNEEWGNNTPGARESYPHTTEILQTQYESTTTDEKQLELLIMKIPQKTNNEVIKRVVAKTTNCREKKRQKSLKT